MRGVARMFEIDGETLSLPAWCKRFGVPYDRANYRLDRGKSIVEALTAPKQTKAPILLDPVEPQRKKVGLEALSPRQLEIAEHLANGESFKTIAEKLRIGISTVANHCTRAYARAGVFRREQLVKLMRAGRVDISPAMLRAWRGVMVSCEDMGILEASRLIAEIDGMLAIGEQKPQGQNVVQLPRAA